MNQNWQHYLSSIIIQLILPLIPLIIELWLTGQVSDHTFAISVAMYSISIGVTSNNIALLAASIAVSVMFSAVFGYLLSENTLHYSVEKPALISILGFMIIHATERYKRHIKEGELFSQFGGNNV